eukprot:scaffold1629_cov369-Prasinococcus_capsulatus_cf.AAC.30
MGLRGILGKDHERLRMVDTLFGLSCRTLRHSIGGWSAFTTATKRRSKLLEIALGRRFDRMLGKSLMAWTDFARWKARGREVQEIARGIKLQKIIRCALPAPFSQRRTRTCLLPGKGGSLNGAIGRSADFGPHSRIRGGI